MSKRHKMLEVINDNDTFPVGTRLTIIKRSRKLGEYKVVWASMAGTYEYSIPDSFVHKYCKPYTKKEDEGILNIIEEYMKRDKEDEL